MFRGWAFLAGLLCLLVSLAADGQVAQTGDVTIGHPPVWEFNGVIGDAGPPTNGILTGVGVTNNSVTGFCQNSHPITQPYVELCFGVTDSIGQITLQGVNEATPGMQLCINGTCYPLPPAGGGGAILNARQIVTGTTDSGITADGIIFWDSASTGAKTETLYTCNAGTKGYSIVVADEIGTAGTYPINIVAAGGNTIFGVAQAPVQANFGSTKVICDGVSNWQAVPTPLNAVFNWINIQAPVYGAVSDEDDSTTCTWTASVKSITCPNKTFSAANVGQTLAIDYAGSSFHAFVTKFTGFTSTHVMALQDAPTTGGTLTHVTAFGKPAVQGTGYTIGATLSLVCGAGCAQINQAQGVVNAITAVSATDAVAGSGGTASATCVLTGTTGTALAGQLFQANVTLNGSGNMGAGSVINSISRPGVYTAGMTDITQEPVTAASNCGALTGVKLNVVMGVYNVYAKTSTGFYSALTCSGSTAYSTTSSDSGTGATVNCNTMPAAARWGTDNTAAFTAAMTTQNTFSVAHTPNCIYLPAGKYLTKPLNVAVNGYGCVLGDAQFQSTIFLIPNTAGDFFQAVDCGNNGALQNQGGTFTYSDDAFPNKAGSRFAGFTIIGMRSSSTIQNGLMFAGRCQWVTIDNYQTYYVRGRSIGVEGDASGSPFGSLLETAISNTRFENGGDPGTVGASPQGTNGIPMVDLAAVGSTSGANNLHIWAMRIFHPFGPGVVIRSCAAADNAHLIVLTDSHFEQSGQDGTTATGDLLQLGDNNCTGETFPTITGGTVAGTANLSVAGVTAANNTFNNMIAGYAAIHLEGITGTPGSTNANNNFSGNIVGTGSSLGAGIKQDAGRNNSYTFSENAPSDYGIIFQSTPNASQNGANNFYNGLGLGTEANVNANIEAALQPTGNNPVSYPTYTTSPGHPLGQFYIQTVGVANAAGGNNSMVGSGVGGSDLGANYAVVGTNMDFYAAGEYSSAASPGSLVFNWKFGGPVLLSTTVSTLKVNATAVPWNIEGHCTFLTIGTSATAYCWGMLRITNAAGVLLNVFLTPTAIPITGLDTTTIGGTVEGFTTQWGTFATGDSIIADYLVWSVPN
jgi:hypothetical protein